MITQKNPNAQIAHFEVLFQKLGVSFDSRHVTEHTRDEGAFMPVVVPASIGDNVVLELFKASLYGLGIMSFIAPVTEGGLGTKDITRQLSDLISSHIRHTEAGSYVYYVRPHVSEESGELIRAGHFDHRMTLIEAFWYHLYMLDMHGKVYLDLQDGDFQTCLGSKFIRRTGSPSLDWDLQDIKVCLRR